MKEYEATFWRNRTFNRAIVENEVFNGRNEETAHVYSYKVTAHNKPEALLFAKTECPFTPYQSIVEEV